MVARVETMESRITDSLGVLKIRRFFRQSPANYFHPILLCSCYAMVVRALGAIADREVSCVSKL